MTQILLIGCGNMGGAMLRRWQERTDYHFTVIDPFSSELPDDITHHQSVDAIRDAIFDVVVIAIKPQLFAEILPDYRDILTTNGLVISIAAGVSMDTIASYFNTDSIVRVMPNLPAMIGESMNGLVASSSTTEQHKYFSETLLSHTGATLWVTNEDTLNRLTAVSGSGPGYVFHLIEAATLAATGLGFSEQDARSLVLHTFSGAANMALNSNKSATELREAVTSKKGTTEAGLNVLMENNTLTERFTRTFEAAYQRAVELS